ncbi:Sodium/calcium exchanger protein-domain-containing protein [Mucidula mucida]|nr:Sodium/calcium exchanger protein-domain-containing protein [Mucidula mucida]
MNTTHEQTVNLPSVSESFGIGSTRIPTLETVTSNRHAVRPPPFSRKFTRALFLRPQETRGPAPGYIASLNSAATYSWVNVLLVFNPIAWALHYMHQTDGMLGTGDALGGLINASLGNATEFIIAILLLVKCEIRVVQASLLGGLLSNLLLVTGMAFIVGGLRFSEQEFQQSAAQLNTSLLILAVIALVMPTVFAFAIEQAAGEDQERDVILEMSRGSALILIFIYPSHLYNPANDVLLDSPRSSMEVDINIRAMRYQTDPALATTHPILLPIPFLRVIQPVD